MEDSFSMCYGTGETAFANPDPGLDPEELSTEKCESDSEDEEEPRLQGLPPGYTTELRETRSGRSYKQYASPGGTVVRSVRQAREREKSKRSS